MPFNTADLESPQARLDYAINILEDDNSDFDLISGIYHRPFSNEFCIQGLLLELSGQGYWQHGITGNYAFCSYFIDGKPKYKRDMFYLYRNFLADYYDLGTPSDENRALLVDLDKLPEDMLNDLYSVMPRERYGDHVFIGNINNEGVHKNHPRIRNILAYILRNKIFV